MCQLGDIRGSVAQRHGFGSGEWASQHVLVHRRQRSHAFQGRVNQLIIDQRRRVLVGATFVGPGVGELLHAATIAIVGEVPLATLWHAVPAFPTGHRGVAAAARIRPGTGLT